MVGPPSEQPNCVAGNEAKPNWTGFLQNSIPIRKFIPVIISLIAGRDAGNFDSRSQNCAAEIHFCGVAKGRVWTLARRRPARTE